MLRAQDSRADLCKSEEHGLAWRVLAWGYLAAAGLWVGKSVLTKYFIAGIGDVPNWGRGGLPDLGATPGKAASIGLHFVAGSVITLLGVWQLWPGSRTEERLYLHRIGGNIMVACVALTAMGGLGFIAQQVVLAGGMSMTWSFALFGCVTAMFTCMSYRTAKAKDIEAHRRWSIRAFSMCAGSFIYRVLSYFGAAIGALPAELPDWMFEPREDRSTYFYSELLYNQVNTWGYWVGTIIFVEWYLRAPSTQLTHAVLNVFFVLFAVMLFIFSGLVLVE